MDGPPQEAEDFSSIPIADRLVHKNWKARVNAYESLIKTFQTTASDTDPAFKPYINNPELLKKITTDSNAVAQEKGVECLVTLVKFAGETAAKTRDAVVPALVDKCFGSSRAGTKSQAVELALQYVEVENGGTGVVADILVGLGAKQPKAVAGCIGALKEVIRLFGTQVTPPPPVLKSLPKIFSHSDKTVRAEGTLLTHTLYQYLGLAIEPWLADLKPVQVKELKEAFEDMDKGGKGKGSLKPERLTRAQARDVEAGSDPKDDASGVKEEEEMVPPDPRVFAEPVDIVPRLPASFQTLITSSKWKERKEVLDDLLTVLTSIPRIKDSPELAEIAKALALRVQGDVNVNCVMAAAVCMEALAKGMMTPFSKYREVVVGPLLDRMKERKANITDTIGAALDAVFMSTTLPEIIPDILPTLSSKNPQVKEGTLKFLGRCLSNATTPVQTTQIKTVSESLATLVEDVYEGARNEAATCLGTLMKMVGERPLNAVMDGLADIRKTKVKEAFEKATVKCKSGAVAPLRPAPPVKEAPAKKKAPAKEMPPSGGEDELPPPKTVAKPPARLVSKKAPSVAGGPGLSAPQATKKPTPSAAAAAPKLSKNGAVPGPGALDTFKYKHTPEAAEALAADLIPPALLADFGDSNWKTRLAAFEEMLVWTETVVQELDAEVVVRALAKKGWGEKNFQVSSKLYDILNTLAECPTFGRSCIALCVAHLGEKLGDMKLKKPAGDTLLIFAEKTSLQFVLSQAYEPLSKQKAPKVLADAVTWINSALIEFGIAGLSLRSLIEFLKAMLQNSNAAVRTSAIKALVTIKLFAGSSIKDLIGDLNPQLLNTITSEFDKVEGNSAPEPSRTSADLANVAGPATSGKSAVGGGDPLDELFPRVEIDALIKGTTILTDAKSDSWKTKKEALETLQAILDQGSNKRLKPNMGEIGQVLKARVTDSNKAVQSLALDIVSRIATGMGKPFEKQTRFFALPIATVLADQKAPVRAAAIQTLTSIATACEGVESMIHGLGTALESSNPMQKASLLHWIVDWFKDHEPPLSLDLSSWAAVIVSSLDDRNGDVRKGAQALLPTLITCAGFDYVMQQTSSLKPASRSSAVPLIQAARPNASNAGPTPPTIAKSSTKPVVTAVPAASISPTPDSPANGNTPDNNIGPPSKLMGVRRKLPQGTNQPESRSETPVDAAPTGRLQTKPGLVGPKRPPASGLPPARGPTPQAAVVTSLLSFTSVSIEAKRTRLGKDANRWINEGGATRKDLSELLQHQMEPHASKELVARLFSHDHNAVNDHINGLAMMSELFSRAEADDVEEIRAAHEPQPNLISKCLEIVEAVLAFLRSVNCQLTDAEALCFIPTMVYKLGDAREQVRIRVQQIIQTLPKVYAYSRVFQLLLDHGLKSKVAKTRQGALDEMASLLKRFGMGACEPSKAFPVIASMIADKDAQVRKSALSTLSEGYSLVGDKVWSLVGSLPPKDRTQLEERLRRVTGPGSPNNESSAPAPQIVRLAGGSARPGSPALTSRIGGLGRPASPSIASISKLARPASPARTLRSTSPGPSNLARPKSPARTPRAGAVTNMTGPSSPTGITRPRSMLPSRLGRPRTNHPHSSVDTVGHDDTLVGEVVPSRHTNGHSPLASVDSHDNINQFPNAVRPNASEDISITISSILSSDPARSVDALKKIQKILAIGPEAGPSSPEYRELAEHTEGLIETITLQMAHVFERPDDLVPDDNFRLAKHLIQTLNNFCDHAFLAESLTVDILTSLLEELTLRLLETDNSHIKKVKDLSRFINMIILRLFATGRRMSIFRALFSLLLQIVKPFPSNGTTPDSKESKVAELVLKCVWKLARNIPQDLNEQHLDPVELFPAIEHFLQSVPPNEWRARATSKVPCGDMPLRTIKVIIQHVVAHYGDDVYDLLSASFDDPSATIVYPYVYRILNSTRVGPDVEVRRNGMVVEQPTRTVSPASSRPISPQESAVSASVRHSSPSHRTSPGASSPNGNELFPPLAEEPDPDAQLLTIIGHISSETTGALHKEGITELHHFLKAYPHKKPRVDKMLESTGPAFRKYITRALASRASQDEEREVAVADTLSKLESNHRESPPKIPLDTSPQPSPMSPRQTSPPDTGATQDKLHRLHDIFQYRSSTASLGSSHGRTTPSVVPPRPN